MPRFSKRSLTKLKDVHPDLVDVLNEAIKYVDFTVLEGARTMQRQKELKDTGKSKTMNSKHLIQGDGYAHAVDIAPWPIDWDDIGAFCHLSGIVRGIALMKDMDVRCGVDWDGDLKVSEHSFFDGPHVEIRRLKVSN